MPTAHGGFAHMPSVDMTDLKQAKQAARQMAKERRAGLDAQACGARLAQHLLDGFSFPAGAAVSGFWPLGDEIDITGLLHTLHARGHPIALPVTLGKRQPLSFRRWQPGDVLQSEPFGTLRPIGDPLVPDILLVPLLAFDRTGARLGYGGGFYDRTLAGLPGRPRIGCAFAAQEMDIVPAGPEDMRLDAVVTEQGLIHFQRGTD